MARLLATAAVVFLAACGAYPHLALAIFLAGEAFCVGAAIVLACSWDRTDPAPPARPK